MKLGPEPYSKLTLPLVAAGERHAPPHVHHPLAVVQSPGKLGGIERFGNGQLGRDRAPNVGRTHVGVVRGVVREVGDELADEVVLVRVRQGVVGGELLADGRSRAPVAGPGGTERPNPWVGNRRCGVLAGSAARRRAEAYWSWVKPIVSASARIRVGAAHRAVQQVPAGKDGPLPAVVHDE